MNTAQQNETRLTEEAADWLVQLEDNDSHESRAAFFQWLQQSSRHVREFLYVTEEYRRLDGMDPQRRIGLDLEELRRHAAQAPTPLVQPQPTERWRSTLGHWRLAAGIAIFIAVLALAWQAAPYLGASRTYTTATGEQRSFKLADGSTLHLNVLSRAEVTFSGRSRQVRLLDGEALFVVQPDAARPFQVATDSATVQVLGTRFNVQRRRDRTTVSVLEGLVKAGNGRSSERLTGGEEARITIDAVRRNPDADVVSAVAWRQRRLVFRDDTLAEVAAEFNRYNLGQIHVEGRARDKQLIGIFNADDPQSLMLFLGRDESLVIKKDGTGFLIRSR